MRHLLALSPFFFSALAVACSSSSTGTGTGTGSDDIKSGGLTFHGEKPALPDFKVDTGLQPAGSPAQLRLAASAGGGITVDAVGENDGGKLAGRKGSGHLKLDLHVKLEGDAKVSTAVKDYEGPIPGLSKVDIPIAGEVAFDPFLTGDGETAKVTAEVPETPLPDVPLGAAPGKLKLTIAKGTVVTTTFHGTCAKVEGGNASYAGEAETSGTLVLRASLALDVPGMEPVDLPAITMPIPKKTIAVDLGAQAASSLADSAEGKCGQPAGGGKSSSSSSGGSSSGGPPPPPPATATVLIDGIVMNVDNIEMWAPNPVRASEYDLFVKISGPGVPSGSDVSFSFFTLGTGCASTGAGNFPTYRPADDTQYMPTQTADCGLTVTELPTQVGAHLRGSFDGNLRGINVDSPKTKRVVVVFDVPRTE